MKLWPLLLRCCLILAFGLNGVMTAHASGPHDHAAAVSMAEPASCHEAAPVKQVASPADTGKAATAPSCCQGGDCACACVAPLTLLAPLWTPTALAGVRAHPPAPSWYRSHPLSLPLRPPIA